MDYGAAVRVDNNAGLHSANIAAYSGSAEVLTYLFETAKTKNRNLEKLLHMIDSNGNMILHAAVDSGSLQTVKVCLQNQCRIDSQANDLSTAVHFAATQGHLEMIQLMFTVQAERKKTALSLKDSSGMTPLHKSVLYDYVTVTYFLLEEGAELDVVDVNDRTPLLLSASKGSFCCTSLLLMRGADVNCVDKDGRNFTHLAIISGCNTDPLLDNPILLPVSLLTEYSI